ncbi:5-methyltetrahydropteroyltriglutamate--homocysteine S-methyltransferase [Liquorilactobacillus sp.]|uniref:5-methyltetrahydropteroyltriglutamate-- homocysteine S-methyltransferase n=1 Tax=Liquorilactobacillus sp. TaxID=2767923 RepID=UPI0039E93D83
MTTTIIGFPRIGAQRELKFATEKYFRKQITATELTQIGKDLRKRHWLELQNAGIDQIPSNDFSFYDNLLDTAFLFNALPAAIANAPLSDFDKYFALARGYQGSAGDFKAWPMKKWFNTNYHYLVPQLTNNTAFRYHGGKIRDEFLEAKEFGITTRPTIIGPFTLLQLSELDDTVAAEDFTQDLLTAYGDLFSDLAANGAEWIQIDEPSLVYDLTDGQIQWVCDFYQQLLSKKGAAKILLQTYFGDIRDIYHQVLNLDFDGIGLDFIEGKESKKLVESGFPADKVLFAGVVNGKNIWRNNYQQTLNLLQELPVEKLVLSTSCSLLHVPYTVATEQFKPDIKKHFAFANEKLTELNELNLLQQNKQLDLLQKNQQLFATPRVEENLELHQQIEKLTETDFVRKPDFEERKKQQENALNLPLLPTTTIGSFPQTKPVKHARVALRKGEITQDEYDEFIKQHIQEWIKWQEDVGFDVLVHGEFERNDMVEYFGQHLSGYLFTKNGWVQSYGTRAVKPPIIWGDVSRKEPITVKWSAYAQSLTDKPVKGMLTGPVTILNWSFPREDISLEESTLQIALAIQAEVLDLEKHGITIIQIDEAALREKLPLRKSDWNSEYLNWAIPAFRLVHSKVQATTQIHTHMCYSEFGDIIHAIDQMDADVISFEASRSNLEILQQLQDQHFKTLVGPGVYDIHSPRVPAKTEIINELHQILAKVPQQNIWVNPDCGLKTRGESETKASLVNLTEATRQVRRELGYGQSID